jgi:hypothetical protein
MLKPYCDELQTRYTSRRFDISISKHGGAAKEIYTAPGPPLPLALCNKVIET